MLFSKSTKKASDWRFHLIKLSIREKESLFREKKWNERLFDQSPFISFRNNLLFSPKDNFSLEKALPGPSSSVMLYAYAHVCASLPPYSLIHRYRQYHLSRVGLHFNNGSQAIGMTPEFIDDHSAVLWRGRARPFQKCFYTYPFHALRLNINKHAKIFWK